MLDGDLFGSYDRLAYKEKCDNVFELEEYFPDSRNVVKPEQRTERDVPTFQEVAESYFRGFISLLRKFQINLIINKGGTAFQRSAVR